MAACSETSNEVIPEKGLSESNKDDLADFGMIRIKEPTLYLQKGQTFTLGSMVRLCHFDSIPAELVTRMQSTIKWLRDCSDDDLLEQFGDRLRPWMEYNPYAVMELWEDVESVLRLRRISIDSWIKRWGAFELFIPRFGTRMMDDSSMWYTNVHLALLCILPLDRCSVKIALQGLKYCTSLSSRSIGCVLRPVMARCSMYSQTVYRQCHQPLDVSKPTKPLIDSLVRTVQAYMSLYQIFRRLNASLRLDVMHDACAWVEISFAESRDVNEYDLWNLLVDRFGLPKEMPFEPLDLFKDITLPEFLVASK